MLEVSRRFPIFRWTIHWFMKRIRPSSEYIGIHRKRGSEMSTKVVRKIRPDERLGVIGLINGKPGIVEFLGRIAGDLPYHRALQRVCTLIPTAEGTETSEQEVVKFELFVFDAIPAAQNPVFVETDRQEEFAPLKNRKGDDSVDSCVRGQVEKAVRS